MPKHPPDPATHMVQDTPLDGLTVDLSSDLALISVTGEDAGAFLHSQLSQSILDLEGARPAAYCSAQGRVLAIFWVLRTGTDFLLRLPRSLLEPMQKRLRLYVLRSRVTIAEADRGPVYGITGESLAREILGTEGPSMAVGGLVTARHVIFRRAGPVARFEVWGEMPPSVPHHLTPDGPITWRALEIAAGLPEVGPGTEGEFIPQMLNLDALGAIHLNKGCYPGQEIVARTHYLGRLKQRLYRAHVETAEPPAPGTPLASPAHPGQAAGRVLLSAPATHGGTDLLVVAQIDSVEAGDMRLQGPDGPRLEWRALPYAIPDPSG